MLETKTTTTDNRFVFSMSPNRPYESGKRTSYFKNYFRR